MPRPSHTVIPAGKGTRIANTLVALTSRAGKAEIVRHSYDSTQDGLEDYNPERHGHDDDRVRQFPTALGSVEFAAIRNTEYGRTCAACGYVNDPFPTALWGWEREVAQIRAVNAAHRELVRAAPSPAAPSATGTEAER